MKVAQRKFVITNSAGGSYSVFTETKPQANRLAKEAERLLGWKVVSVVEDKK